MKSHLVAAAALAHALGGGILGAEDADLRLDTGAYGRVEWNADGVTFFPLVLAEARALNIFAAVSSRADVLTKRDQPVQWSLEELYLQRPAGDFRLFVGKRRVQWDNSPFSRPQDFFETDRINSNPESDDLPREGRWGAGGTWQRGDWEISVVGFDDLWAPEDLPNRRGGTQWGTRVRGTLGDTSLAVLANGVHYESRRPSFGSGAIVSQGIGDQWQLYADGIARFRPLGLWSRAADEPAQWYQASPWRPRGLESDDWGWEHNLGVVWTPEAGQMVTAAWLFDSQGLTSRQWSRIVDSVELHQTDPGGPWPASLVDGNRSWDLGYHRTLLVRPHHGAFRWAWNEDIWETSVTLVAGLDGSLLVRPGTEVVLFDQLIARVYGLWLTGPPGGEFSLRPHPWQWGLSLRWLGQ